MDWFVLSLVFRLITLNLSNTIECTTHFSRKNRCHTRSFAVSHTLNVESAFILWNDPTEIMILKVEFLKIWSRTLINSLDVIKESKRKDGITVNLNNCYIILISSISNLQYWISLNTGFLRFLGIFHSNNLNSMIMIVVFNWHIFAYIRVLIYVSYYV